MGLTGHICRLGECRALATKTNPDEVWGIGCPADVCPGWGCEFGPACALNDNADQRCCVLSKNKRFDVGFQRNFYGCSLSVFLKNISKIFNKKTKSNMKLQTEKRVLVTGGAGFLGSHLCERLLTMAMMSYVLIISLPGTRVIL